MKYIEYLGDSFDEKSGEFDQEKAKKSIFDRKENINILLLGASGVGKSSLVNAFFGLEKAKVGEGEPVTQQLEKHVYPDKGLVLWDTKGIEVRDYQKTYNQLDSALSEAVRQEDVNETKKSGHRKADMPHVAWLCIKESGSRVEDMHIELVKLVEKYNIPLVVVFTDTKFENGQNFFEAAKNVFDNKGFKNYINNRYVRVNSVEYTFLNQPVPLYGLESLLNHTEDAFPDGSINAKRAFDKAQDVDGAKKLIAILDSCNTMIHLAAVAAGTAGASPIPGSDAPIIAAVQAKLIHSINSEFGLDDDLNKSASLIASILGVTALASVGRATVSNVIKFIPGAGSVIGGAISATTAIALTELLGHAYVNTLKKFYVNSEKKVILPEQTIQVVDQFTNFFKSMKK